MTSRAQGHLHTIQFNQGLTFSLCHSLSPSGPALDLLVPVPRYHHEILLSLEGTWTSTLVSLFYVSHLSKQSKISRSYSMEFGSFGRICFFDFLGRQSSRYPLARLESQIHRVGAISLIFDNTSKPNVALARAWD